MGNTTVKSTYIYTAIAGSRKRPQGWICDAKTREEAYRIASGKCRATFYIKRTPVAVR